MKFLCRMLSALKTLPMSKSQVLTISSHEHLPVFPGDGKKDIEQGWPDFFARGPDLKKKLQCGSHFKKCMQSKIFYSFSHFVIFNAY